MIDAGDVDLAGLREALRRLATGVDDGRVDRALAAYKDARVDGLCHEGAWECAVEALRTAAGAVLDHQHGAVSLGDD